VPSGGEETANIIFCSLWRCDLAGLTIQDLDGVAHTVGVKACVVVFGEEGRVAAGRDSAAEDSGDFGDGRGEMGASAGIVCGNRKIISSVAKAGKKGCGLCRT
jgi:hypothetical protein